jgi:protein SCO1/2
MNRRRLLANYALGPLAVAFPASNGSLGRSAPKAGPRAGYFPNFLLRTQDNEAVHFYDDLMRGRSVVINMMYAQCEGICPAMTANLVRVQDALGNRLGRDIFMYSLSLQPDADTPAALKSYADMHGVGPGWLFLTGRQREMEILRRKLGFFDPDPAVDQDRSQHLGLVRFGNEALDRWAACPALSNPEQIVRSILWTIGNSGSGDRESTNSQ